ncbi:hypothetical protein D3C79_1078560 [compost metagenome]
MGTDFTMGEQLQRTVLGSVGVMKYYKLNAIILIGRDVAAVDARAAGATSQGQEQQGANEKSHRKWQRVSRL